MGSNLYVAATGAMARMRDLDVVANNLANVGTPGYKREESVFRAVLESSLRNPDGRLQRGAGGRSFVSTDEIATDFTRGSAERTGSDYHAMIDGPGFFEVQTEEGPRYTRSGNFIVNARGQLATPDGSPVQGQNGAIPIVGSAKIMPTGAAVDANGNVAGIIKVVDFQDRFALQKVGGSLFAAPADAEATPVPRFQLIPGSVESSNVDSSVELSNLVILQRAFEASVRALQLDDQNTQRLIEGIR